MTPTSAPGRARHLRRSTTWPATPGSSCWTAGPRLVAGHRLPWAPGRARPGRLLDDEIRPLVRAVDGGGLDRPLRPVDGGRADRESTRSGPTSAIRLGAPGLQPGVMVVGVPGLPEHQQLGPLPLPRLSCWSPGRPGFGLDDGPARPRRREGRPWAAGACWPWGSPLLMTVRLRPGGMRRFGLGRPRPACRPASRSRSRRSPGSTITPEVLDDPGRLLGRLPALVPDPGAGRGGAVPAISRPIPRDSARGLTRVGSIPVVIVRPGPFGPPYGEPGRWRRGGVNCGGRRGLSIVEWPKRADALSASVEDASPPETPLGPRPSNVRWGWPDALALAAWTGALVAFFWDAVGLKKAMFYFDLTEINYPYRDFLAAEMKVGAVLSVAPGDLRRVPALRREPGGVLAPAQVRPVPVARAPGRRSTSTRSCRSG